jgi:signal recognition particle subunit SEC65
MTRIQTITTILSNLGISYHVHYDCNNPKAVTVSTSVTDAVVFKDELTIAGIFFEHIGIEQGGPTTKVYL